MSLLVSEQCAKDLNKGHSSITLMEVSKILEGLDSETFKERRDVSKVKGSEKDIYVLRYKSMRMFFTYSKNDLVLLSTVFQ